MTVKFPETDEICFNCKKVMPITDCYINISFDHVNPEFGADDVDNRKWIDVFYCTECFKSIASKDLILELEIT